MTAVAEAADPATGGDAEPEDLPEDLGEAAATAEATACRNDMAASRGDVVGAASGERDGIADELGLTRERVSPGGEKGGRFVAYLSMSAMARRREVAMA
jgi:hypothetical protein